MRLPLSHEQVDVIWKTLTIEQQNWINEFTSQRKRDKWFEGLARRKGIVLEHGMTDEDKSKIVDDWELVEILDGGEGNRPFRCECGTALRYQYTVYHPSENKTYHLGSTCIEHYTGLSADVVRDIKNGILQINTQRDEILLMIKNKEFANLQKYLEMGIEVPESIRNQVKIGIPILKDQLDYLEQAYKEIVNRKRLEEWKKREEEERRKLRDRQNTMSSPREYATPRFTSELYETFPNKATSEYTYESFMNENIPILKQIREREELLSPKLREEWEWMQQEVRRLKKEGTMDFDRFVVRMNNMMHPLRITR